MIRSLLIYIAITAACGHALGNAALTHFETKIAALEEVAP